MIYRFIFVISTLFIFSSIVGQERLLDLYENPVLLNAAHQKSGSLNTDTIDLPFFDDFSSTKVYPNTDRWLNDDVFVNDGYAVGQPSIGVATLDAVSADGTHYENAASSSFPADSLTSKPIRLKNKELTSLYLSFYYQPQGNGNAPEKTDSLLLQFKNDSSEWNTVWFSTGETFEQFRENKLGLDENYIKDTVEFLLVNLPLSDSSYLFDGFQFRFVNYASLAGPGNPSRATNCDHWNVDYIYLNEGRSIDDIIFKDIAFVKEPDIFMRTYTTVPWLHYPAEIGTQLTTMELNLRNNNSIAMSVSPARLYFEDMNSDWNDSITIGTKDIDAFSNSDAFKRQFSTSPIPYSGETGDFIVRAKIYPSETDAKVNNEVSYEQHFTNYYAYDDGGAEKIYGHNTNGGLVAYKFNARQADSLQGVYMYFLRNKPENQTNETFMLCVWADDNGIPGELLVSENTSIPDSEYNINEFVPISLEKAIWVEGDYYVGWQQLSDDYLNVGFDKNNYQQDKIFYNLFGAWEKTSFLGALMIRPAFGASISTAINERSLFRDFTIHPNPTNNSFSIIMDRLTSGVEVEIYNMMGILVLKEMNNGYPINVSLLSDGVYFVNVRTDQEQYRAQRLVISK